MKRNTIVFSGGFKKKRKLVVESCITTSSSETNRSTKVCEREQEQLDAENVVPDPSMIVSTSLSNSFINQNNDQINDMIESTTDDEDNESSGSKKNYKNNENSEKNHDQIHHQQNTSIFDVNKFQAELACWAVHSNVNHEQLKGLLGLWNKHVPLPNLPQDPRTVLQTPRSAAIDINGGYWHYGLKKSLLRILQNIPLFVPDNLSLNFNIDGIPISKSSSIQFWPILFDVQEIPGVPPQTIGIYCGSAKPENIVEFLSKFVEELKSLMQNGINFNGTCITIGVRAFICDSPARAFIKGIYLYEVITEYPKLSKNSLF